MTVLGDGAAAVLLTKSGTGRYELVDQIVRSDGRYADLFRIDYRHAPENTWIEECADEVGYSFRLAVESRNRFTTLNAELLARNGVPAHRIDAHITQNLAVGAFAFWQEALGVPISGVCASNLARFGHLGSADVLLNIEEAARTQPSDGYSLVMNSSPVAAWSGWLLRRLPDGGVA
jgi:3-oxoacyl-[acyl-carrier-protein] synthase-3